MVAVCNAGLHIVYNLDEVTFVQNLVYYIEEAYRIPVSHIAPVQTSLCSSVPTRTMVYGSVVTRPIMGRLSSTLALLGWLRCCHKLYTVIMYYLCP